MLLQKMIARGDRVEVLNGKLVITPVSGQPVPTDWLNRHTPSIMGEIAQLINMPILCYDGFSTGKFAGGYDGVSLSYRNLLDHSSPYACFNVHLSSARKSNSGQAGLRYKGKQFRVGDKSAFKSFWLKMGLMLPQNNSKFHTCMGKLKVLFVVAEVNSKRKIQNETLTLFSISYVELCQLLGHQKQQEELLNNDLIVTKNVLNSDQALLLRSVTKHSELDQANKGLEPNSNYGKLTTAVSTTFKVIKEEGNKLDNNKYINSVISSEVEKNETANCKKNNDDWLSGFGEVEFDVNNPHG